MTDIQSGDRPRVGDRPFTGLVALDVDKHGDLIRELCAEDGHFTGHALTLRPLAKVVAHGATMVAYALREASCRIADAIERPDDIDAQLESTWARVELFGHTVVYGYATEVKLAGRRFIEVVEPEITEPDPEDERDVMRDRKVSPEKRRYYNPSAVYAFEPISEQRVREAIADKLTPFGRSDY